MNIPRATSRARKAIATLALGLVAVLAAPNAALGQEVRGRITISGETIDDLRADLSLEGIDWSDPEAVVRAGAEIKAEMRLLPFREPLNGLVGMERERYYRDIVTPDLGPFDVGRITGRRGEEPTFVLGAREDLSDVEVRISWEDRSVALDETNRGQIRRTTLRRDGERRWRIVGTEMACRACRGSGLCRVCQGTGTNSGGSRPCGSCGGARACDQCSGGFRDDPLRSFRRGAESPHAPEIDRTDPASVARAVALGDFFILLRVAGVQDRLMQELHEMYCREFFARDAIENAELVERRPIPFDTLPDVAVASEETLGDGRSRVVVTMTMTQPSERDRQREPASIAVPMRIDLVREEDGSYRAAAVGHPCRPCDASGRCPRCQGRGRPSSGGNCTMCGGEGRCRECRGERFRDGPLGAPF